MNKALEKIANYFIGLDAIKYYEERKQRYKDTITSKEELEQKLKSLDKERNKHMFYGKIIPNAVDISAVAYMASNIASDHTSFLGFLVSSILVGGVEAIRANYRENFAFKPLDDAFNDSKELFRKINYEIAQRNLKTDKNL